MDRRHDEPAKAPGRAGIGRRSRWLRRLALGLVLAPLVALPAPGSSRADGSKPLVGTPLEDEAYLLYKQDKVLTARTRAQEVLDADPDSIVGHYVLGSVLRDAEGSLPRSMAHLREARRLFELRYGRRDKDDARLHVDILWGIQSTAGLMEQFELQLQVLDEYDEIFNPQAIAQHAWPLMKLQRYDEARAYARRGLASGNAWQEITALNALCAIEAEAHERRAAHDACKAAYDHAHKRALASRSQDPASLPHVAVHAYNAALGAMTLLDFGEAERLALEGTRRMERTGTNPYRLLAWMYLGEGRADDAVAALREMQRWCAHQPPEHRDQKSAETDGVVADVLLAAGEADLGLRFISRALDRPDRRGLGSSNAEQSLGAHAVTRRALLRLQAELSAERASWEGVGKRGAGLVASLAERAQAWPDDERAIAVLSDEVRLVMTLRPYQDGGLEFFPSWLTGDLIDLLGPGVVSASLARARAEDVEFPGMVPFFDALEAEVALARGETARALRLASSALEHLPPAEALQRARVAAVGAEAAAREADVARSAGLFERAMQLDPGAVRRLGLALPATVQVDAGGEAAERAGALLRRSPRLREAAGGFVVRVTGDGPRLTACLFTGSNAQLACGSIAAEAGEPADHAAARLAEEFHHVAFAMRFSLTATDLRSLDGATTMAQGSAREALRGLLGDGPQEGGEPPPP